MSEKGRYLGFGDCDFVTKESFHDAVSQIDDNSKESDKRILELEKSCLACRARERVFIAVIFFLLGGLSSGFWLINSYSSAIVRLSERQDTAIEFNRRQDSQIADLWKYLRNGPDIRSP